MFSSPLLKAFVQAAVLAAAGLAYISLFHWLFELENKIWAYLFLASTVYGCLVSFFLYLAKAQNEQGGS